MSERSMEVTSRLIYTGVDYNNLKLGYILLIILNYNVIAKVLLENRSRC